MRMKFKKHGCAFLARCCGRRGGQDVGMSRGIRHLNGFSYAIESQLDMEGTFVWGTDKPCDFSFYLTS